MKLKSVVLILGALAALGVSACHRKHGGPALPNSGPLVIDKTTPDAHVRLTMAPSIGADPVLRARLYDQGSRELNEFLTLAHDSRAELIKNGMTDTPQLERTLDWTVEARTDRLVSLKQSWNEEGGGAHPNHGFKTLLWDAARHEPVTPSALFRRDADSARLDAALCEGLRTAKTARGIEADDSGAWPCPGWKGGNFVLMPSTIPGKAGGLTFLFDPYAVGSYAEGDYEVPVPLARFQDALAPAWAADFAGAPAPPPPAPKPAPAKG